MLESLALPLEDPTHHAQVYAAVRDRAVPRLNGQGDVHVNVSPGTPAMHAVRIVLHASDVAARDAALVVAIQPGDGP